MGICRAVGGKRHENGHHAGCLGQPIRPVDRQGGWWCCKLVRKCGETIKQPGGRVFEVFYGLSMNMVLETIRAAGAGAGQEVGLLLKSTGESSQGDGEILSHLEEAGLVIAERHENKRAPCTRFMSIPG